MNWDYFVVAAAVIVGVLLGVSSVAFAVRRREKRPLPASGLSRQAEPVSDRALSPPEFERLVVDLHALVAGGDSVLVAGPGVAVALGEPTPTAVCRALLQSTASTRDVSHEEVGRDTRALLGDLDDANVSTDLLHTVDEMFPAEAVQAEIGKQFDQGGRAWLVTPPWVRTLQALPFGAIVSLSWSDQFDGRLGRGKTAAPVVTWGSGEDSGRGVVQTDGPVVFKPLGSTAKPSSLRLWLPQRLTGADSEKLRALSYRLSGSSLVFVGMSPEEISSFMDWVSRSRSVAKNIALISARPDAQTTALLELRHDIGTFSVTEQELTNVLDATAKGTSKGTRVSRQTNESLLVRRARLVNIGPFTDLSLELHKSWTVLLGDNGSGKSTVLKAVALCLAGQGYGSSNPSRLLNVAATEGRIEVTVGVTTFTTMLLRDRTVRVETVGLTPVEAGKLLAIGLPPLRGVVAGDISGPKADSGYQGGDPVDLVPLIAGALDSRFDDIRQWLVNVAVAAEGRGGDAREARAQLETMFDIFRRLNPGLDIEYAGVDRRDWDVQVAIDGGDTVPVRLLSQGSLATLSWIGLLVKRLADVFGPQILTEGERATGLVIIDEIDAHLHPEWQRNIIPALSARFPSVQFLASTHSPLIVGALEQDSGLVLTIKRYVEGDAEATDVGDFTGWRADQILTSDAFGLESTRDVVSHGMLTNYEKTLRIKSPDESPSVTESRKKMEKDLKARLPGTGSNPRAERTSAAIIDAVLEGHLKGLSPKEAWEVSDQLSADLSQLEGGDG